MKALSFLGLSFSFILAIYRSFLMKFWVIFLPRHEGFAGDILSDNANFFKPRCLEGTKSL
jgi:hypothetical protein